VTVTVRSPVAGELPDQGVTLLIHDSHGALVGRTTTDVDGRAEITVPPAGSVTAIQRSTSAQVTRRLLTTITDVQPGDALRFAFTSPRAPRPGITFALVAPARRDGASGSCRRGGAARGRSTRSRTFPASAMQSG